MVRGQVRIRPYKPGDDRSILETHRSSVHGLAIRSYPPHLLEEWSPPITDQRVARVESARLSSPEQLFVALSEAKIVGFGGFNPETGELTAVYVHPDVSRQGVGTAILHRLEAGAQERGLTELWLESSLNAVNFYAGHGYKREGDGEHRMASGRTMPCVRMRKRL